MPAAASDVVACLAVEHGRGRRLSVNTIDLRRVAIRYLRFIAGLTAPTAEAYVALTVTGITEGPIFRRIWAPPSRAFAPDTSLSCPVIGKDVIDDGTVS